jgi:hypothetical protein
MPSPACTVACAASARSAAPPTRRRRSAGREQIERLWGGKSQDHCLLSAISGSRLLLVEKERGGGDASVARVGIAAWFSPRASLVWRTFACDSSCWCCARSLGLEFATPTCASGCWRAARSLTSEGTC